MKRIRIGRRRARSERPWPGALSPDPREPGHRPGQGARAGRAFRKGGREMIAWTAGRLWLAARTVIRAVRMANDEQVYMWECLLLTSGAAPLTAAGRCAGLLRWTVTGSSAATCRPRTRAKRGGNPGWRPRARIPASAPPADPPRGRPEYARKGPRLKQLQVSGFGVRIRAGPLIMQAPAEVMRGPRRSQNSGSQLAGETRRRRRGGGEGAPA
jgi:hypothetical protein